MPWLKDTPIAHRGLHDKTIPENSLKAFEKAVVAGYPIELDVFLTPDEQLVVFHDNKLQRLCQQEGLIWETPWERLSQCKLKGTDQEIPLLSELLDLVDGRVPVMVEIKYQPKYQKLVDAVENALKEYKGEFVISSGYLPIVRRLYGNQPSWRYGYVSGYLAQEPFLNIWQKIAWQRLFSIGFPVSFIAFDVDYLPYWPVFLHRKFSEVPVVGYTVKSLEQANQALKHCDNIFFEHFDPSELNSSD